MEERGKDAFALSQGRGRKKKKKNRRESNRCCCVKNRRGKGVTRGLVCRKEPFFELFAVGSLGKEGKCFFVPYACVQEEIMESYLFFSNLREGNSVSDVSL